MSAETKCGAQKCADPQFRCVECPSRVPPTPPRAGEPESEDHPLADFNTAYQRGVMAERAEWSRATGAAHSSALSRPPEAAPTSESGTFGEQVRTAREQTHLRRYRRMCEALGTDPGSVDEAIEMLCARARASSPRPASEPVACCCEVCQSPGESVSLAREVAKSLFERGEVAYADAVRAVCHVLTKSPLNAVSMAFTDAELSACDEALAAVQSRDRNDGGAWLANDMAEFAEVALKAMLNHECATHPSPLPAREPREVTEAQLRTMYAVIHWNHVLQVHPLTCGNDSRHASLVPVPVGDAVHLWCVDCDYKQTHIPPVVRAALSAPEEGR